MIGLTKINQDWIPLQVKVFSRWVSNQLKDSKLANEVRDIQKDLSNGVALVELATVLTHKQPNRGWSQSPKLKVEMVQNCELAIDMFTKDGVNFVGISGKDISDNNQKLILGFIWTLILHYSVSKSVTNAEDRLQLSSDVKHNQVTDKAGRPQQFNNSQEALISWANRRIENYPNVHNFDPYGLSLCALLDSYFPQKINYYSLNPADSAHNSALATKVMKEAGIPIYVYPEELEKHDKVDEKTLLTQLSSAKFVLDNVESSQKFKLDSSDDDNQSEVNVKSDEINKLSKQIISLEAAFDSQKVELAKALDEIETQRIARATAEKMLNDEKQSKSEALSEVAIVLKQLYQADQEISLQKKIISKYESEIDSLSNENTAKDEEIARLMRELEKVNNDVKELTETIGRQSIQESKEEDKAEIERLAFALENSESYIESQENEQINDQTALEYFTIAITDLQHDFDQLYKQKAEDDEEIKRLRCAFDMAQIEIQNERDARQEDEFELENLKSSHGETRVSDDEYEAEQELRVQSLLSALDEVEKSEYKAKSDVERLESEIKDLQRRNKATTEAYSDAVESALHEANQEKKDREKAEEKIAQLTLLFEHNEH